MSHPSTITELTGKLLIAMPDMGDPRFEKSVVLVCAHSEDGAMGLIVNKPVPSVDFSTLAEQLDLPTEGPVPRLPLHFGGPVETGRGFVLHSTDYQSPTASMEIPGGYRMTTTLDVLEELAAHRGPKERLLALGYAGWGPGQLEGEIQHNGWLTAEADAAIIFSRDNGGKWDAALKSLGIDALHLSGSGGRA
jgi:putative transcriptional regulator